VKIDRITCRVVDFPLEREFHPAWARGRNQPDLLMVLIEVHTDEGYTGVGAAHAGLEAAITIERFVAPYFIGQDPTYVERLAPVLRDTEILGAPVYCMEMPLWDLVGKVAGLPALPVEFGTDRQRPGIRRQPPRMGEHNAQVLAEAGFTAAEVTDLAEAGVIAARIGESG